jgi:glucose-1-phosphate thymidylyltransferase
MKALVLSGGSGTRLRPFSHTMPKQLIPVAGKPVLQRCLESIRDAGITEVGVIVGDRAAAIQASLPPEYQLGLSLTYIQQDAPLGLAHCVAVARGFLRDHDFVMYLGDNVLDEGITELADSFRTNRTAAQLTLCKVRDPRAYGVAEIESSGQVLGLWEKPARPRSDLAVAGVYFFTPLIHEAVRAIRPSHRGELEITDAVQWLIDRGYYVRSELFGGYWQDTGYIDGLLECNRTLLGRCSPAVAGEVDRRSQLVGSVIVESGARVIRSRITGPALIGADTLVVDSTIGPSTAVGRACRLTRTGIVDSIVLDEVSIDGVEHIGSSVIGRAAEITRAPGPLLRIIVGDHSSVQVA